MKFEWEQPDGSVVEIGDPDLIVDVLNDLRSRIEIAKADGRSMEEAALRSKFDGQYGQLRWYMARYYQAEHHELLRLVRDWELALSWWTECAESSDQEGLSELQESLLAGISADLRPKSWDEARRILDYHPRFKIPPSGLHVAIEEISTLIPLAKSVRDAAEKLAKDLFDGTMPNQEVLDRFQSRRNELKAQFDGFVAGR